MSKIINWQGSNELQQIGEKLQRAGGRPILVGGWVRDRILGLPAGHDYDVEVFGLSAEKLSALLGTFGTIHAVGKHFGVFKLDIKNSHYDFSLPRRESNIGPGHKNFTINTDPKLDYQEAASRRDFTINSLGYAFLEDTLLDPFNGYTHLQKRWLQHISPAFAEDPLRVLRAMQLAARFGLEIAPETLIICRKQDLAELPKERIWEEWKKLLLTSKPSQGLSWAPQLGICDFFPPLKKLFHHRQHWEQTLSSLDKLATIKQEHPKNQQLVLMLAGLLFYLDEHPNPPPLPRPLSQLPHAISMLESLIGEQHLSKDVLALLADALTPQQIRCQPTSAMGDLGRLSLRVPIALLHTLLLSTSPEALTSWLEKQSQQYLVWETAPTPLIKGKHLLELGYLPGSAMGKLLKRAFQAQLNGHFSSQPEGLKWLKQQPLLGKSLEKKPR